MRRRSKGGPQIQFSILVSHDSKVDIAVYDSEERVFLSPEKNDFAGATEVNSKIFSINILTRLIVLVNIDY